MEVFTENQIKNDLKNLKYFNNSVQIYEKASRYFTKQYELAKNNNIFSESELKRLEECITLMDKNRLLTNQMELKQKYLNAISKLDTFTQAIIIDAFINDSTYIEISHKMYCSVETVKRRVKLGISSLCSLLNAKTT